MSLEFHFLNERPKNCNIICNSDHSNKLGILGSSDNPMHDLVLYLGDRTEMWPGSSIILSEIPDTPIHLKGDGIIVDLTVIRESIILGLPTCDCCPIIITNNQAKAGLAHISTETLGLYKTASSGNKNSHKIPILHQIFSLIKPENCIIWMGPCIQKCCYEFSAKDADLLKTQMETCYPKIECADDFYRPHNKTKVYVDFPNIIVAAMVSMGVNPQSIVMEYCSCTVCGVVPRTGKPWHSYRKSGNTDNHNWAILEITP